MTNIFNVFFNHQDMEWISREIDQHCITVTSFVGITLSVQPSIRAALWCCSCFYLRNHLFWLILTTLGLEKKVRCIVARYFQPQFMDRIFELHKCLLITPSSCMRFDQGQTVINELTTNYRVLIMWILLLSMMLQLKLDSGLNNKE